jgi:DNA gyrase/topoisomerase IV subunit B
MAIKQTHAKEIIALNMFEAVRLRPTMYIGQKEPMLEKLPIIVNGKLKMVEKAWSPGFMHLIVEILENALDEAKRCKGKMKNVYMSVNLDTNEVIVKDEGTGFYKAYANHSKTKKNVVRTAFEELHAGSNFIDSSTNILGTHGVGAAVTNILSENFKVTTINKTYFVHFEWTDFKVTDQEKRKKAPKEALGTTVSFIPSKEVFPRFTWDEDLIKTYLSFKSFLIKSDPIIKNLNLVGRFIKDGKESEIEITSDFIEGEFVKVDTNLGSVYLWEGYEDSCSLSFVNGSQCTGIHQKIVNDWVNDHFKYNLAHHFYETLIVLNVPSHLMRFADQNKTKYATGRGEIEEEMEDNFKSKLIRILKKSEIAAKIEQKIEDRLHAENISKIKKASRQSKRKISEKYSPPSKKRDTLYITEGLSARGSVIQARDSEIEGVYALKGKVKNTRKLSDLTNNTEILEIMSVLEIFPDSDKMPSFDKIVIAADEDPDGHHISSLIINFFQKWFPHIIKDNRLYKIITPLVACNHGKNRHYFYTLEEFNEFAKNKNVQNVTYLKGLGSLCLDDWKHVMDNKVLFQIYPDRSAKRFLDIAFGVSAQKRKKWLEGM